MREKLLRMADISSSNTHCNLCAYCKRHDYCLQEVKRNGNSKLVSFCSDWEEEQ
jgi:hypothetical protein